jgi:hypothetical protein
MIALGGSRVAQHILHLGDQGEGFDLAARLLNRMSGAEVLTVAARDLAASLGGVPASGAALERCF